MELTLKKTSLSKECELCRYWYFKDVGYKVEELVCNGCHDLLTMAQQLGNIAIFSAKGATFSRNDSLRRLNNSVLEDKSVL